MTANLSLFFICKLQANKTGKEKKIAKNSKKSFPASGKTPLPWQQPGGVLRDALQPGQSHWSDLLLLFSVSAPISHVNIDSDPLQTQS